MLACVGMPTEITIYLSADHIRAEESSRGIREVVQKNYASSNYMSLLTSHFIAPPFSMADLSTFREIVRISHEEMIYCLMKDR